MSKLNVEKAALPSFASDEDAEEFVGNSDLTQFDLSGGKPVNYEFRPKATTISMRVSQDLLDAVKVCARQDGVPYQRFIRQTLEAAVMRNKR
ncbi:BrnA antitoxin family protein [uncultured Devosia sp.]|uniref:BrnA antitoxin family protein n=1 Tax=uncultured Devosia sp. TaxID=211434 RepID=UPI0035CAEC6E